MGWKIVGVRASLQPTELLGEGFTLNWDKDEIFNNHTMPSDDSLLGGFKNMYDKYPDDYDILTYFEALQSSINLITNFVQNQFVGLGYIAQSYAILFMEDYNKASQLRINNNWNVIFKCFKISDYRKSKEIQRVLPS